MRLGFFFRLSCLLVVSFLLVGCSIPFLGKKKQAALRVTSVPGATIFLDGKHVGTTPFFDEELKPGEYSLKLTPEDNSVASWEGKVRLTGGILTVVSRELASSPELSSGYLLSLEPITDKKTASLAVVTVPDGAVVSFDDEPKGFAPLSLDNLSEGEHLLVVSSPGYVEKSLQAKLVKGYKLTASVQLAKLPEETERESESLDEEATPSAKETKDTEESVEPIETKRVEKKATTSAAIGSQVKIKDTPTGWLNVRSEPSTAGKEETIITKVDPGETFPYVESSGTGWYKIELDDGEEGWVVATYAELIE